MQTFFGYAVWPSFYADSFKKAMQKGASLALKGEHDKAFTHMMESARDNPRYYDLWPNTIAFSCLQSSRALFMPMLDLGAIVIYEKGNKTKGNIEGMLKQHGLENTIWFPKSAYGLSTGCIAGIVEIAIGNAFSYGSESSGYLIYPEIRADSFFRINQGVKRIAEASDSLF